jgi:transposase
VDRIRPAKELAGLVIQREWAKRERHFVRAEAKPYELTKFLDFPNPRCRPDCVVADRGYDAKSIRHGLRVRRIMPLVAMRRTTHGSGLECWRWVVERTFAWLNQFRRLRVRYDKRADIHTAFLSLECALICWRALRKTWPMG